ncbi:hypothetical protein COCSUDRAFT_67565 [Coccomyxa subellipsoidea C-169]|uniref:Uncharacterized protein n=1 Tax=Coccomyxa subellipsoidea (strain C-169) TaxID=574566 RepID=I0YPG7_COCSC|nr:hypothetical protein COCSUDRAFT_67565 [Coccomyxa subellipsoidea C-169]EIE20286.1 hypothetical protein COCSUDRAFT_67565 [Coccomyxa subellipsoidea C-169]|eukprot:XP_005644830.1 hypothetical protein COCSUDRAFT_67565 [Coccomyxa subellipsoidea C-169]
MAETAVHFMKQRKAALSAHMDSVQNAIDDLTGAHKLTDAEAECLVQLAGEQAIKLLKSQLEAWESLLRKDKDFADTQESETLTSTPQISDEARRSNARSKLAAMGGQPVLGGAFLLPEGELLQRRQQLASTSSPAAQEMARLRATSLDSRMAPAPSPMQSPPWLMRKEQRTGQASPSPPMGMSEDIAVSS